MLQYFLNNVAIYNASNYGDSVLLAFLALRASMYGVFAPNSNLRAEVTASQRGKNSPSLVEHLKDSDMSVTGVMMTWKRMKTTAMTKAQWWNVPVLALPVIMFFFYYQRFL